MSITRVLALGDTHCGHAVGLTHPDYQWSEHKPNGDGDLTKRSKYARIQRECWQNYKKILTSIEPIHKVLFLGDAIDGRGAKSGGVELITSDREDQCDMAASALNEIRLHAAKGFAIRAVYGTDYHVGSDGEDWENIVADKAGIDKIGSHEWPSVNGLVFDMKHKVGSSSIPHGRSTATLREMLWNEIWAAQEHQPRCDVLLRGHVHYAQGVWAPDITGRDRWGFTLPALQAMGSRYGARQCSGIVHWGMMHFDVSSKGELVDWKAHIVTITRQVAKAEEL